jgi:pyruvate-formate lyase-activating enzyme
MEQRIDFEKTLARLNKKGKGFCAAKWYNATIWLSNGRTSSCHHPPAHNVESEPLADNPSALHNTEFKKQQRQLMLSGERPAECGYCWKVEDTTNTMSDRVYKSVIYTHDEIESISNSTDDVNPKTLEISFDNLCNLACSYCNAEFSSTWNADISSKGSYELQTPGGQTYNSVYKFDGNIVKTDNQYVRAFFSWLDAGLADDLQELRVTGGEPTMSPHFWKMIEGFNSTKFDFAVNTNLCVSQELVERLAEQSHKFDNFELYTSCEATGKLAEFVRSGFDWERWKNNLDVFVQKAKWRKINVMMTISLLSLPGLIDFLNWILEKKKVLGDENLVITANILRFPSFQSVNMLPVNLKAYYAQQLKDWLAINDKYLSKFEIQNLERLVEYLQKVDVSYEDTDSIESKKSDLSSFVKQYTQRRGFDVSEIYNKRFNAWLELIE